MTSWTQDFTNKTNLMALSHETRVHLIYQFILFTLLYIGASIALYAFLPIEQRTYGLLITLPLLVSYATIFGCCLQIIPIPKFMNTSCTELNDGSSDGSLDQENESSGYGRTRRSTFLSNPSIQYSERHLSSRVPLRNDQGVPASSRNTTTQILKPILSGAPSGPGESSSAQRTFLPQCNLLQASHPPNYSSITPIVPNTENESPSTSQDEGDENSELMRSYSFPIRQKRLVKWAESRKNHSAEGMPEKIRVPYWQTVGYILDAKKEARDRRRVHSGPGAAQDRSDLLHGSADGTSSSDGKHDLDKSPSRNLSSSMGKFKAGFCSLFSRSKDDERGIKPYEASNRSKGFFGRKRKSDSRVNLAEDSEWQERYVASSSHRNFLEPESEEDPFEPDTLESHLSLFPEGMNRLSRKDNNPKT